MNKILFIAALSLLTSSAFAQTDIEPPTLVCKQFLAVNLEATCQLDLWAVDLVETLSDTPPEHLIELGIRKECTGTGFPQEKTSLTFTASEIGMNTVELWAKDLAGNTSHCKVMVFLQAFLNSCDPV